MSDSQLPDEQPLLPDGTEPSESDWRRLQELGKHDLYFLSKAILGYKKLVPHTHQQLCRHIESVESMPDSRKKIGVLMPRGHYKTTIGTIADSIRRLVKNPDERILIYNEAAENAELMLAEIKRHVLNNERFRQFYPYIIPKSTGKTVWSRNAILLPRPTIAREPSVTAVGANSAVVSRHFSIIKFDDLIGMEASRSPAVMEHAKSVLGHAVSLLISAKTGEMHIIGTRWTLDDIYQHAMENMNFNFFVRKAIVHGENGEPQPLFPEEFSMEFFHDIIMNDPEQWASQYSNDPYDLANQDFKQEWLQYYSIGPDHDLRYYDSFGRVSIQERKKLKIYLHVDPSMGEDPNADFSVIVVAGVNSSGQVFVLDVVRMRLNPTKLVDKLFELNDYWNPVAVSIETTAFQKSLIYFIKERERMTFSHIPVRDYKPTSRKSKEARIRGALQPFFSHKMIFIHPSQVDLVEEYSHFGSGGTDDIMDALAQGPEFWRSPPDDRALERHKKQVQTLMKSRGVTGYGI